MFHCKPYIDGFVAVDPIGTIYFFARKGNGWRMILQSSLGCAVATAAVNESGTKMYVANESEVVIVISLSSGERTKVISKCQRILVRIVVLQFL